MRIRGRPRIEISRHSLLVMSSVAVIVSIAAVLLSIMLQGPERPVETDAPGISVTATSATGISALE
jgi:hypothetical protein